MPIVASRALGQLDQQSGFADACLAGNEGNAAAPLPRRRERVQKSR
jgi:hypothetical protein